MKEITVKGMTCPHCSASVTKAVSGVDGVENVNVDLESGKVTYTGPDGAKNAIKDSIEKTGFEVEE